MSQKLSVPHPKKKIDKTTLIVLCVIGVVLLIGCVILGAAFDYALAADGSIDGSKISPALHYVLSHPALIFSAITKKDGYVPKILFVGVCVIGIFALYKYSEEPKRLHRRGTEHGSAKWGDEKEIRALAEMEKKPHQLALRDENGGYLYDAKGEFICADVDYNIVLAKDVYLALNTKQHRLNLNTLVIGGSGSGKTLFWVITNILQLNTSFVITDPKGEIYQATAKLLREAGYEVRVFNTIQMEHSNNYNPFHYIYDHNGDLCEDNVKKMADVLFQATKGDGEKDDFWSQKGQTVLLALMFLLIEQSEYDALFDENGKIIPGTRDETNLNFYALTVKMRDLQYPPQGSQNVNEGTTYGTDSLTMYEIALKLLNQTRIVVNKTVPSPKDPSKTVTRVDPEKTRLAQEKAKQIEAKFAEWIFADPERKAKYEKIYNDRFNALVGRQYDGSRLTFNGMANDFELRPHQRDCIARAVYGGNTLAAHVVGAGKSAVFISAVMKKKELGLINKACIVVPKALTEQTALEWRRIFPDARLLTVGEMDLSTQDKRDVFTARIATGNYDAVIVSREQFDKMAMSPAYQHGYIQREIDELEDMLVAQKMAGATKNTPSVKKIEAAKKRLEKRLEKALDPKKQSTRRKDDVLEFEQLGFDYLVVDESHAYKNGFVSTKMTDVSGVTVAPSGRAQDMQMKCDWMNEMLGQGHILHCTGTPVSNSMTELYVVTRYLHPELLKAAGVERFDDWAATFGKVVCAYKQSPSGQLKLKTSFAKFANLPELMAMYKEFADIQSAEKLHLPRPELIGGKPEIVKVEASPEQRAYVRELAARAQLISTGVVDPHLDNLLKITGEARLVGLGNQAVAALYRQREEGELPEGFMEEEPGKVDACVDRVWQYYNETNEQKGVQIIFSDIAVNSDNGNFSVYEYIRDELIAKGIPRDEIIFAPKADSKDRAAIFRDINDGKYRVVIGSTGTIGTGANIQQRLYALHNCDIPWKPSDFEQREGRILRQGNTFPAVRILNYVTEGTLDSYLYQVVTDKARFIAQLLDDECPARVSEDCDEKVLTYAELQAAAEGNPDFKTRIELSNKIAELLALQQAHQHEQGKMQKRVDQIPGEIDRMRTQIVQMLDDKKSAEKMRDAEGKVKSFDFITPMRTIRKHEDINAYLHQQIAKRIERPFDEMPKYRIGDFTVSVELRPSEMVQAMLAVKGQRDPSYSIPLGSAANADNWQRIVNFLDGSIEKAIEDSNAKITKLETDLKQAQELVGVPFDREEELLKAKIDFAELEARLSGLSEQQDAIIDPDETDEEETAEERAEREAYQNADDDDYPMIPDDNTSRHGPRR